MEISSDHCGEFPKSIPMMKNSDTRKDEVKLKLLMILMRREIEQSNAGYS